MKHLGTGREVLHICWPILLFQHCNCGSWPGNINLAYSSRVAAGQAQERGLFWFCCPIKGYWQLSASAVYCGLISINVFHMDAINCQGCAYTFNSQTKFSNDLEPSNILVFIEYIHQTGVHDTTVTRGVNFHFPLNYHEYIPVCKNLLCPLS